MTLVAEPQATTRVRRADIALLRIVAIVGVVVIHVSGLTVVHQAVLGEPVWVVANALKTGSRWCVPLFVLVSGALLLRPSAADLGAFYRRRLSRLLPALVVWHLVYIAFRLLVLDQPADVKALLAQLLTGRTYTALYFFWLILGLYLVTPLLARALQGLSDRQVLVTGAVLTAATCAWQSLVFLLRDWAMLDTVASPTVMTYWLPYVGYFVLGAGLARLRTSRRRGVVGGAVALLTIAVTVVQGFGLTPRWFDILFPEAYHGWLVAASTVGLYLLAAGLVGERSGARGPWRVVETLAGLTLGVFALHLIVLYVLQQAPVLTMERGATRLLELAVLLAGTVTISFVLAWVMSRVPVLRRLV